MDNSPWVDAVRASDTVRTEFLATLVEPIDHSALVLAVGLRGCRVVERLLFAGADPVLAGLTDEP